MSDSTSEFDKILASVVLKDTSTVLSLDPVTNVELPESPSGEKQMAFQAGGSTQLGGALHSDVQTGLVSNIFEKLLADVIDQEEEAAPSPEIDFGKDI